MDNKLTAAVSVDSSNENGVMKTLTSLPHEAVLFNTDFKNDSCPVVSFQLQNFNVASSSEEQAFKVMNFSEFIPNVCTEGHYNSVLVSDMDTNHIEVGQTVPQQSQILLLASEPVLNTSEQENPSTEATEIKFSHSQKYFGTCRICANGTTTSFPLYNDEGISLGLVEKIHRCLPIKVSESDGLPQQICGECSCKLETCDGLIKLSIAGNAKLQAMEINWTQTQVQGETILKETFKKENEKIINSIEIAAQQNREMPNNLGVVPHESTEQTLEPEVHIDLEKVLGISSQKREWSCNECDHVASRQSSLMLHKQKHNDDHSSNKYLNDVQETDITLYSCEYCDKNFPSETKWKKHIQSHTKSAMQQREPAEKCTVCNEEFLSAKELQKHLKDVHNLKVERKYCCDKCDKSYGSASGLDIHRATHSDETPCLCDICGKSFKHKANLRCHRRSHADEKVTHRHACNICPKSFPSKFHLSEHKNVHLNVTPYSCGICEKKFHRRIQLRQHRAVHNHESSFECPQCGASFNRRGNMTQHMKLHLKERKFTCKVCKKSFDTLSEVVQHRREHTAQELEVHMEEKSQYICTQCQKPFSSSNDLEEHIKTHLNTKFQCELCLKELSNRRTLDYHVRAFHTQERPFPCQYCSETFLSRESCVIHERLHTGEKPYMCSVCKMSFRCSSNLAQHYRTHQDERPWTCDHCPKRFKRKGILLVHMRTHTGEKPFCCDICGRRFTQKNDMLKHQQTHSAASQTFVCSECNWPFHTRKELNKHRRTHHIISRAEPNLSCDPTLLSHSQALVITDSLCNFPITILEGNNVVVHQIEDMGDHTHILEVNHNQQNSQIVQLSESLLQTVVSDSQILTIEAPSGPNDALLTSFNGEATVSILPAGSQQNC